MTNQYVYSGDNELIPLPDTYALDIAIEEYFQNVLDFKSNQIIYASNDYCLRERLRTSNNGTLNLPFMSYHKTGYSTNTYRHWKTSMSTRYMFNDYGTLSKKLGTKIKVVPARIKYESLILVSQDQDKEEIIRRLLFERNKEIVLHPTVNLASGDTLKNVAVGHITISTETYDTCVENNFLKRNNINFIRLGVFFDTFMLKGNTNDDIGLCKNIVCNFIVNKYGTENPMDPSGTIITYFENE